MLAVAVTACLIPAQNDSWWHLRAGQGLWETGRISLAEEFSYTARGRPWPNHEWLWQAIGYPLWRLGGMPLLTAFGAAFVVAAYALCLRLTEGAARLRFAVMAVGLPLSSEVWALRPQVASLFCLAALLTLLVRGRLVLLPPLFLLWANLHGAVALGGVVLAGACLAAAIWDRRRLGSLVGVTVVSAFATAVTPLGFGLWSFIGESITRSTTVRINEWKPADLSGFEGIAFYLLAAGFLVLLVARRRRLTTWGDRVLAVTALLLLPMAGRYVRNVPPFLLAAMPAASRLLARRTPAGAVAPAAPEADDHPRLNLAILAGASLLGVAAVAWAWAAPWKELGWRPFPDRVIAAVNACPGPLYNRYDDGGYLIWFAPGKPVFVDSRQDPYPPAFVAEHVRAENRGDFEPAFGRWGIRCAVLPEESPTLGRLRAAGWIERAHEGEWTVLGAPP